MLLHDLEHQECIAVDTESNSLYAYRERICLMQFSTRTQDYILDPLAVDDIEDLGQVFANPDIEKVFHAAEYDLSCLYRDCGWEVKNIFDTMAAARALGWQHVGLAKILHDMFNVASNKKFQRANWGRRPLSREQLIYAQADSHYLLPLRDRLADRLQANGHWDETQEDFARIAGVVLRRNGGDEINTPDPDAFWRIAGARSLNARQAAVLRELFLYRETAAARVDLAPFRVIGNSTLLEISQRNPRRRSNLNGIVGMTPRQIRRHGKALVQAVARGRRAPALQPPIPKSIPPSVLARYDALHDWRKTRARTRGVESDVIMPRSILWDVAYQDPSDVDDLKSIPDLGPWRRRNYGEEIVNIMRNVNRGFRETTRE